MKKYTVYLTVLGEKKKVVVCAPNKEEALQEAYKKVAQPVAIKEHEPDNLEKDIAGILAIFFRK